MEFYKKHPQLVQFALILIGFFLLILLVPRNEGNVLWRFPSLIAWLPGWINTLAENLMFNWFLIEVYDADLEEYEQSALIREITRGFSRSVLFIIEFIREILVGGVKTIAAFVGYEYIRENPWAVWPALPWTVVAGGAVILGYALQGRGLALLAGLALGYISVFGQWEPAMETLSFVLVCGTDFDLGWVGARRPVIQKPRPGSDLDAAAQRCANYAALFLFGPDNGFLWCWRSCRRDCYHYFCHSTDDPADAVGAEKGSDRSH